MTRLITCTRCGEEFGCATDSVEGCWCKNLPPLKPIPSQYSDCLCANCLSAFVKDAAPDSSGLTEGADFYLENGNMVFTEKYHLDRGKCCDSGCRHCPYR